MLEAVLGLQVVLLLAVIGLKGQVRQLQEERLGLGPSPSGLPTGAPALLSDSTAHEAQTIPNQRQEHRWDGPENITGITGMTSETKNAKALRCTVCDQVYRYAPFIHPKHAELFGVFIGTTKLRDAPGPCFGPPKAPGKKNG
jgi:hypothetical protein